MPSISFKNLIQVNLNYIILNLIKSVFCSSDLFNYFNTIFKKSKKFCYLYLYQLTDKFLQENSINFTQIFNNSTTSLINFYFISSIDDLADQFDRQYQKIYAKNGQFGIFQLFDVEFVYIIFLFLQKLTIFIILSAIFISFKEKLNVISCLIEQIKKNCENNQGIDSQYLQKFYHTYFGVFNLNFKSKQSTKFASKLYVLRLKKPPQKVNFAYQNPISIFPRVQALQLQKIKSKHNNQVSSFMNSNQLSYFFLYCASQPYINFNSFNYLDLQPQTQPNFQQSLKIENEIKTSDLEIEGIKESYKLDYKKIIGKQDIKRKQKKLQSFKNREKDVQFKQRQQTANRNLCSNTLKVYFKQLRDKNAQTYINLSKIIQAQKVSITLQNFLNRANIMFSPTATYISFDQVKKICHFRSENLQDSEFAKVLRISIWRFFSYEIFSVNIKSIRTTRKIRNQQIKQGKYFLRQLFH